MSNGKKLKKMVQNGQNMNQQVDPNVEIVPGDGVEEPKGLVGFFIKGIRLGRKVWNKTPTVVKYGLGAAVLVGTGAAGAKFGYNMASKKYKPEPELPDNDTDDEEIYEDDEDFDDSDQEDYATIMVDAGDSPVTITNTGEIPVTITTETTE